MEFDAQTDRALVLSHRDLAARLTQSPLDFTAPERWNGFVPPEHFNGVVNRCQRRAALVEIVTEAHSRRADRRAA